jgi:hypothetical protein
LDHPMNKLLPIILALVPLGAVISACVMAP